MAAKFQATYEDFEPLVESSEEDGCTILTIYLPGFSKDQIRVQVSSTRKLRIFGERPYKKKAMQRFHKEFQIPPNCNTNTITAKYKGGILRVRQPLQDESKPLHTVAVPEPQRPEQQVEDPEEKSSLDANGKVEDKSTNEIEGIISNSNANKIMSRARRLKKVASKVLVKFILPVLVASLLFMLVKRLSSNMFVGVEEPQQ